MKALVLGAGGQLGSDLTRLVPEAVGLTHDQLSITNLAELERAVVRHRPEVVFNCAAYNAVDRAEAEPAIAFGVNSDGALNIARACRRHGVRLVHFSTNFVFDGLLDRPYVESDPMAPVGAYARSKAAGEERVLAELPSAIVVRTAALFGATGSRVKGGSFPDRILSRASGGEPIRVVDDQRVNPTYTRDLAQAAFGLAASDAWGLVHVVGAGCCSWAEFARGVLRECGVDAEVQSITSAELRAAAPRPPNGCLASQRAEPLRSWQEALHEWAAERERS